MDVGCGPGCTYENLKVNGRDDITYRGLDVAPGFVQACQELFPDGDFRMGDAMALDEPDNSWDVVLLRHTIEHTINYVDPILEAMRVARRKVIIVMWRPLLRDGPDRYVVHEGGGSNDYNATRFQIFLEHFMLPMTRAVFDTGRPNWGWVLHKAQDECVFDLDDMHDEAPAVDMLFDLKAQFPALKVTLFTIPSMSTHQKLMPLSSLPWVELAVHGWSHHPNTECLHWTEGEAHRRLEMAEGMGVFVKGFKAPGWQINELVMRVLKDRGYWLAGHEKDRVLAQQVELPHYIAANNPMSVHGHMQDIHQNNPWLRNGLNQLIHERGLPWDQHTRFYFAGEKTNGGST